MQVAVSCLLRSINGRVCILVSDGGMSVGTRHYASLATPGSRLPTAGSPFYRVLCNSLIIETPFVPLT